MNPGSAVRLASVARHVTDFATRPGVVVEVEIVVVVVVEVVVVVIANGVVVVEVVVP